MFLRTNGLTNFVKKHRINDEDLFEIIKDIEKGKIDADYGGGLIKQRLARKNQGKSGGYRCIILYRFKEKLFFVYGFAKKMFNLSNIDLNKLAEKKILIEVDYGQ